MNKILSWKIKTGVYAYIYLPNSNTHISKRITEDSPLWRDIISSVSKWSDEEYRTHFNDMSSEVSEKYGKTISWNDDFLDFDGDNSYGGVNIVMLAGEDADTKVNSILDGEISSAIEDFNAKIDAKLAAVTAEAVERNKEVKEFVDQKVNETIARATATINQTKEELSNIASEAMVSLSGATDAINKAAALFELGEGGIDSESIKDAVNSVKEQNEWINGLSGHVTDFKTDYDIARSMMGSIGTAEDATAGLFSRIATSLNAVSGTAGTVSSWMVASAGTIQDSATWYNTHESSVTEAVRYINASAGTIGETLNYVNGEGVNSLKHEMNALSATIATAISTSANSAVTRVEQNLNGLSGIVETTITRFDEASDTLTSMGDEMNAVKGEINKWMTITQDISGTAIDLRDSWTAASGKLSSVANLLVEYDENGEPIYQAYKKINNEKTSDIVTVTKVNDTTWQDGSNQYYTKDEVFLKYTTATQSYIMQEASALTLAVMETPEMTAQIALKLSEDDGAMKSIIDIVADEVNITADVIAKSLTTKEANIGGITIGNGRISTIVTDSLGNPTFKLDGNTGGFSASNAYISGHINAKSLTIGEEYPQPIFDYINGMMPLFPNQGDITNLINDAIDELNIDGRGYITEDFVNDLLANNTGFTEEQTSFIQNLVGAEINDSFSETTEDGVTTHKVKIGDNEYTWKTVDTGDYLVLGSEYGNEESDYFVVSTEGLLTANNAVIHGKIYASEGYFQGDIKASTLQIGDTNIDDYVDGTIIGDTIKGKNIQSSEKIKNTNTPIWAINNDGSGHLANENISWDKNGDTEFRGSFRQIPENVSIFDEWDIDQPNTSAFGGVSDICMGAAIHSDGKNNDNLNMLWGKGFSDYRGMSVSWTTATIPTGEEQIGRKLTLCNYKNKSGYTQNVIKFILKNDEYYFYENGDKRKFLMLGHNDIVELFGLGYDNKFLGWVVTNRVDLEYGLSDYKLSGMNAGIRPRIDTLDENFKGWSSNNYLYLHPWLHTIIIPSNVTNDIKLRLPYNMKSTSTREEIANLTDGLHIGQEFEVWKTNSASYKVAFDLYDSSQKICYVYNGNVKTYTDEMTHVTPGVYKAVWDGNMWYITFNNN